MLCVRGRYFPESFEKDGCNFFSWFGIARFRLRICSDCFCQSTQTQCKCASRTSMHAQSFAAYTLCEPSSTVPFYHGHEHWNLYGMGRDATMLLSSTSTSEILRTWEQASLRRSSILHSKWLSSTIRQVLYHISRLQSRFLLVKHTRNVHRREKGQDQAQRLRIIKWKTSKAELTIPCQLHQTRTLTVLSKAIHILFEFRFDWFLDLNVSDWRAGESFESFCSALPFDI